MSVIAHPYLSLALKDRPVFLLRLEEFVASYGIAEESALILQAHPSPSQESGRIDVNDEAVRQRFGGGVSSQIAWWNGFRSPGVRPCFRGIASRRDTSTPDWASELHRDGHLIAGVWRYPASPHYAQEERVIYGLYAEIFDDFMKLITNTLGDGADYAQYDLTATLTNASRIKFSSDYQGWPELRPAVGMEHLQWPTDTAAPGSAEWSIVLKSMQQALFGAYGLSR